MSPTIPPETRTGLSTRPTAESSPDDCARRRPTVADSSQTRGTHRQNAALHLHGERARYPRLRRILLHVIAAKAPHLRELQIDRPGHFVIRRCWDIQSAID